MPEGDVVGSTMIAELQADASSAGRGPVDVQWTYTDPSIQRPTVEVDRHIEVFDGYTKMGVTSLVVSAKTHDPAATLEFIEAFGATYLR